MEGIYEVSSSEKVRTLEEDLRKELKELQHEIEEGSHLDSGSQRTFGSVPLPKDVDHFRRERKLAINKALQVREAQPLVVHADVMQEEMEGAMRYEYTAKSLPLLLHQFYNDRISQLVQCKHMHMLRWARFCEHTKAIENLYSAYQKRLSHIMEEYHDALQRARRLAAAAEATLAESDSAMQSVTVEDLMFYTRWLVCYMHSVKTIHAFLRVIEWLPTMHKDTIKPHMTDKANVSEVKSSQSPTKVHGNLKRVLSHVSLMAHLQVLRPQTTSAENVPPPPPLSLSPYQLVSAKSPSLAAAAAASGGGLASDEINLGLPLHGTAKENFKPVLEFLMNCYAVDMEINQLNTHADEMELFTIVCRRFKKVFFKQEQLRTFPTYDASIEELGDSKIRSEGVLHTFKQQSNWLKFVQLRAEKDSDQVKTMTKLKQENNIDELLKAHSKFLHVEDGQRVMSALKEHAKAVMEPPEPRPVSVTTHRTSTDTVAVWKRIFSYASSRDDVLEFQAKLTDEDMGGSGSASGEFELGTAVELLGLDDEEAKSQAHVLQGAYMAYLLLRHLRLRDLQRTCLSILNYFRSVERTLTINDGGLSLEGGTQKSNRQQVYHGGGVIGIGSHQYIHNTPADYKLEQTEFMEFSEIENHDDFYSMEEGRVHVQDQKGYYVMYDSGLADFKKVEQEMLLVATHYIQTDKEFRQPRGLKFKGDQLNISSYGHQPVDRFGVLLDLWTNEAAYLENKRQLLDCYLEAYHHVFDSKEKRELAQVITNIIHQRPRFDFTASYFVKTYRAECVCLRLHCNLIKNILDQQIDQERGYNQRVSREDSSVRFGLPHRVIPQQHISINTSRPALKYIYMLEFHPSLALASRVLQSLKHAFKHTWATVQLVKYLPSIQMVSRSIPILAKI